MTKTSRQNILCLLIFVVVGAVLYSRTLHIPWLFDDIQNILQNPLIQDLKLTLRRIGDARGVAFFSFALNYHFGQLDPFGFHIVNIAIHIITSWLVFLIMRRIFRDSFFFPMAGALIFLAHPIQTQAINYIVQRMASMCGLFFFLSIYLYIRARETAAQARPRSFLHQLFYILSLTSCVLALWTKQNAAVLPLALLLFEKYFGTRDSGGIQGPGNAAFPGPRPAVPSSRLLYLLPFILVTMVNAYQQVGGGDILLKEAGRAFYWAKANETSATSKVVAEEAKGAKEAKPANEVKVVVKPPENLQALYLATEMSVLWLYIRLLFLPVHQVFDYGYPLVAQVPDLQTVIAFAGHLLLLALAVFLRNRRPLISFGIFWFYLTLAVESSLIPLDAAVEHRLYMTVFGFALVFIDLLRLISGKFPAFAAIRGIWNRESGLEKARDSGLLLLASLAIAVFMILTWQRNALWSDTIAFAQDNLAKAPFNQRNYLTLANAYAEKEQWREAENTLRAAIKLRPDYPVPYENLGSALARQGRYIEAVMYYTLALDLAPENVELLYNTGLVLIRVGDVPAVHRVVQRLKPLNAPLANQLEASIGEAGTGDWGLGTGKGGRLR